MSWWRWKGAWTYGRALTHISCVALAKFFTLRSLRFLTHKTSTTTQSCRAVVGIALGEVPAHGEGSARPGELAYAWVITGVNDLMPLDASSSTFTITMTLRGQAGTTPVSEAQSDGWQAPRPLPPSPVGDPEHRLLLRSLERLPASLSCTRGENWWAGKRLSLLTCSGNAGPVNQRLLKSPPPSTGPRSLEDHGNVDESCRADDAREKEH